MNSLSNKLAIVLFPGSNCDSDCLYVFKKYFHLDLIPVWHQETTLPKVGGIILPGGFSYGDYLRGGKLASLSPIMKSVADHVIKGGAVLGICNGFQILTECGLLPGALLGNTNNQFICKESKLQVCVGDHMYYHKLGESTLSMPIAHAEGRYFIDKEGFNELQDRGQIVFRYQGENPNGSVGGIAGICSPSGRVLGMMPHPERSVSSILHHSEDGLRLLNVFLSSFM